MNEMLFGEVSSRFGVVLGNVSSQRTTCHELRLGQYMLVFIDSNWRFLLGFGMRPPPAPFSFELGPNAPNSEEILAFIREIARREGWNGHGLARPRSRPDIYRQQPLVRFLAEEESIAEAKVYLLEQLEKLVKLMQEFPELPWNKDAAVWRAIETEAAS